MKAEGEQPGKHLTKQRRRGPVARGEPEAEAEVEEGEEEEEEERVRPV